MSEEQRKMIATALTAVAVGLVFAAERIGGERILGQGRK